MQQNGYQYFVVITTKQHRDTTFKQVTTKY